MYAAEVYVSWSLHSQTTKHYIIDIMLESWLIMDLSIYTAEPTVQQYILTSGGDI